MRDVLRALVVPAALLAGCVFGFRGEAPVEATFPLDDIIAVRVDLPATPISVVGDPEAAGLELRGEWRATGGDAEIAKANARTPRLVWARSGSFAELTASVPLAVDGQVDLEVEELRLPPDRDLELRTDLGDVSIVAIESNLGVDVGAGDVDILGGAGGIAVRTGLGDVVIETTGNTDVLAPRGTAVVTQAGPGGNDIVVRAGGDVQVWLASDADLDLDLLGREIRVQTGTVSTIDAGHFARKVGGGFVKVWIDAGPGRVEVRMKAP